MKNLILTSLNSKHIINNKLLHCDAGKGHTMMVIYEQTVCVIIRSTKS